MISARNFMRLIAFAIFILASSLTVKVRAEYRAYLLTIKDSANGSSREVIGTLDDQQYRGYNILKPTESVTLTKHWWCHGSQGHFQKVCANAQVPHTYSPRGPASVPAAKPTPP